MADKQEERQAPESTAQGQRPSRTPKGGGGVSGKQAAYTGGEPADDKDADSSTQAEGARSRAIREKTS